MYDTLYVSALSNSGRVAWAGETPARADGPYGTLPQAEYAARIWRRLGRDAEIAADGPRGPWWVHVRQSTF